MKNGNRSSTDIDIIIGKRVKTRRLFMGYNQEKLAHFLEITFQQVQKYENGTNRISAGRLVDICKALNVDANFLLDNKIPYGEDILLTNGMIELARAYSQIKNPIFKKQIVEMAKAISSIERK